MVDILTWKKKWRIWITLHYCWSHSRFKPLWNRKPLIVQRIYDAPELCEQLTRGKWQKVIPEQKRCTLSENQIRKRKIDQAHSLKIHHDCGEVECSFKEIIWWKENNRGQKLTNNTKKNINYEEKAKHVSKKILTKKT